MCHSVRLRVHRKRLQAGVTRVRVSSSRHGLGLGLALHSPRQKVGVTTVMLAPVARGVLEFRIGLWSPPGGAQATLKAVRLRAQPETEVIHGGAQYLHVQFLQITTHGEADYEKQRGGML